MTINDILSKFRTSRRQRYERLIAQRHTITNRRVCITAVNTPQTLTTKFYITIDGTKITEVTHTDPRTAQNFLTQLRINFYQAHRHHLLTTL